MSMYHVSFDADYVSIDLYSDFPSEDYAVMQAALFFSDVYQWFSVLLVQNLVVEPFYGDSRSTVIFTYNRSSLVDDFGGKNA